jgi:hypothetical protein
MPVKPFRLRATTCLVFFIFIIHANTASAGDFLDEKGNWLGTDGLKNDSLYLIRTSERNFAGGGRAAGISPGEANKAKKDIRKWNGITDSFHRNPWIYFDFQIMESRISIRQKMLSIVKKDDGRGEGDRDNREYGGTIACNYKVLEQPPGSVSTPRQDAEITIKIASNTIADFHSHPSGRIRRLPNLSTGDSAIVHMGPNAEALQDTCCYYQPPSPEDIYSIGVRPGPDSIPDCEFAVEVVGYVFGIGDGNVYIYTRKGITAIMPVRRWVKYNKIIPKHK